MDTEYQSTLEFPAVSGQQVKLLAGQGFYLGLVGSLAAFALTTSLQRDLVCKMARGEVLVLLVAPADEDAANDLLDDTLGTPPWKQLRQA